ncbi:hypothetical protein K8Z61_18445 [Nocardioides sp. TRM66260-LWL]|uniref:hypothetical protein n=1 Tax=Nocardioides sp. TRM66260-LWL TaxID=2874478 RepID=UPI001CC51BF9|nr:hypothetical protein [Nocardioides sp. TRM66260-LWL]MBZ5736475.1 hypothetical protein [Nocardioides sp. TRM66260-LWL]
MTTVGERGQQMREYEVWSTYKVTGVAYVRARSAKEAIEKALNADAHGVETIYGEPHSETKMRARRLLGGDT